MTTTLGGPREGNCRVRSWLAWDDHTPLPDDKLDEQHHGVMAWADFIADMEQAGATRPTCDLFFVTQPNGLTRGYRAVNEEYQP